MRPRELETLLLQNPEKPHRLALSSGDQVIVPNARAVWIEGISLYITRYVAPERLTSKGRSLISIPNVVLAEVADRPIPPTRRRRT